MFCKSCWANLPDATLVCTECGADPAAPPKEASAAPKARPKPTEPRREERTIKLPPPVTPARRSPLKFFLFFLIIAAVAAIYLSTRKDPYEPGAMIAGHDDNVAARLSGGDGERGFEADTTAPSPLDLERYDESEQDVFSDEAEAIIEEMLSSLEMRDYSRAVSLSLDAANVDPEKTRFLASKLVLRGEAEYNKGFLQDAERLFTGAVELVDKPTYLRWLAHIRLRLEDFHGALDAVSSLSVGAQNAKVFSEVYEAIGTKYFFEGRTEEAVEAYERGLELVPGSARLKQGLERLRSELKAEDGFTTKEGSHFSVKFESGENAVTGHVISLLLEEAYIKVGSDLGFYPDDIVVAVLYGGERFRDTTRSPSWAGAIYDGRIKLPVGGITSKTDLLESVLFHEYTHAVVHRIAGTRPPVWLNEGLAQYEEGKSSRKYKGMLKEWAMNGNISLTALEGSFMGMSGQQAGAAYLLSLSAVEYIATEFGLFSVVTILEGLGQGKKIDEAINDAIYLSYTDLEESWIRSLKR